jgi:hypothetical protein
MSATGPSKAPVFGAFLAAIYFGCFEWKEGIVVC